MRRVGAMRRSLALLGLPIGVQENGADQSLRVVR